MPEQNNTPTNKKGIPKKEFWYSYIIGNVIWLYILIYSFMALWECIFCIVFILPFLVFLIFYGTVVNVQLLNAKKLNNAKLFSKTFTPFITIGFTFTILFIFAELGISF